MILLLHIPAAEDVPPNMGRDFLLKQIFLFNPFSIEIFKSVLANIIDSYYEAQRELLIICYYPSGWNIWKNKNRPIGKSTTRYEKSNNCIRTRGVENYRK